MDISALNLKENTFNKYASQFQKCSLVSGASNQIVRYLGFEQKRVKKESTRRHCGIKWNKTCPETIEICAAILYVWSKESFLTTPNVENKF